LPQKNRPILIASGGTGDDTKWTEVLSHRLKDQADAISFHYYTIPTGQWEVKGPATGFTESQWIATFANSVKMDSFIKANVAVMDKNDPEKKLGFDIDEWGTWYDQESKKEGLLQQNTLRDAIVAALNFNIFHAHADRVRMTNIAQMVNVLQSMILTDGKRMVLTPTYHVYSMYVPFQNASSLPVSIANNPEYKLGDLSISSLSASAARGADGKLYLSLVNVNPIRELDVHLDVTNSVVSAVQGKLLTGEQMDAHNSFSAPEVVKPTQVNWQSMDGKLNIKLPAKAILVLNIL
jgi:alpha-N-arabinofuranosidase